MLRSFPVLDSIETVRARDASAAMLFVLDPERGPGDIEPILREIFGFLPLKLPLRRW